MFYTVIFAASAFAFLTSCSGEQKENSVAQDEHSGHNGHEGATEDAGQSTKPQFEVNESFQKQLGDLFNAYVDLKDAFVSSDVAQVKKEAAETGEALAKVDMKLLTGAAHNDWMNYSAPMEGSLKEIQANDDIEAQRKSFSALTGNLYKSIKAFGLGGEEAFYEYCPMAFDNEGAYWLSAEEKIRNPYFGDKMPGCGEVKERLQ
jgi:Cu(I)/Ag(I) efflux system membrane fusion protein